MATLCRLDGFCSLLFRILSRTRVSNIGMILLVLFGGGILGLFIYSGLAWFVQQCQTIDIEKAKENNAIVPVNPLLDL